MEPLFVPIDLYCERISADFFSEPLNLFSNLIFLILAFLSWRHTQKHCPNLTTRRDLIILHLLFLSIGIGSFIFHGFANRGTQILDVLPIVGFMLYYLYCLATASFGVGSFKIWLGFGAFILINLIFAFAIDPTLINGSNNYLGSCIFLFSFGFLLRRPVPAASKKLAQAAFILCLAIIFRSLDQRVCDSVPIGSHFLWHLLTAVVLFKCLQALLRMLAKQNLGPNSR